jgi:hypothetical protein
MDLARALSEIIFVVEDAPEGGYTARALGHAVFTEADDVAHLHEQVRDAVRCHFDDGQAPKLIRLHFVREEVLAV